MLANDSVTVAVEVPIWLTPREITAIEAHYRIEILPKGVEPRVIAGHIDFVQVRNGAVHILDYKPDARTNRSVAQLTIYALALAWRTGVKLFDIKCAWFNVETFCEFFPRTLMPKRRQLTPRRALAPGATLFRSRKNGAGGRNRTDTPLGGTGF
jgi:PD-(D/E)XK nuclease superfamily